MKVPASFKSVYSPVNGRSVPLPTMTRVSASVSMLYCDCELESMVNLLRFFASDTLRLWLLKRVIQVELKLLRQDRQRRAKGENGHTSLDSKAFLDCGRHDTSRLALRLSGERVFSWPGG